MATSTILSSLALPHRRLVNANFEAEVNVGRRKSSIFPTSSPVVIGAILFSLVLCSSFRSATASSLSGATFASSSRNDLGESGCDWSGSGFDIGSEDGAAIRPVRLRCAQGAVEWSYPRGALRITLAPSHIPTIRSSRPSLDTNSIFDQSRSRSPSFRLCLKASPSFAGARIYSDDGVSLSPLFLPGDGKDPGLARCVTSSTVLGEETVVLYVEADTERREFKRRVASFAYDITPINPVSGKNGVLYVDPDEECRPCDDAELLKAYCSSDFVMRGRIHRVTDVERLDTSEIVVEVTRTLRQPPLATPTPTSPATASPGSRARNSRTKRELARISAPLQCKVKSGPGEYVFSARFRLGDTFLTCAATLAHWVHLVRDANGDGRAPCVLDA